jgi:flagellar basal-body rod protein FlgB
LNAEKKSFPVFLSPAKEVARNAGRGLGEAVPVSRSLRGGLIVLKEMLFGYAPDMLLGKMLDKAAVHQRVISSNVANVTTPGYERLGVDFDEALKRAMKKAQSKLMRTHPRHLPNADAIRKVKPEVVKIEDGYWNGINNVNIDQEMTDLAKNQLDFEMAARLLEGRFSGLRTAIRGRR